MMEGGMGMWPGMSSGNSGNMIAMTNPDREIKNIEEMLRGNPEKKLDPLMNDKGVNKMIGLVRAIVNRGTIMSNMSDTLLYKIMEGHALTCVKLLMMNKDEFGIKSDADRTAIFHLCVTMAHITILRGREGDDKRFWKGNVQEINYMMHGDNPQPGLVSRFNPFSK